MHLYTLFFILIVTVNNQMLSQLILESEGLTD